MATRIIEYADTGRRDNFPVLPSDVVVEQAALTANGTSQQSSTFNFGTGFVCVQSDEAVYVKFGTNPTATTNSYRLQAGGEQCWSVVGKSSYKVAVRT